MRVVWAFWVLFMICNKTYAQDVIGLPVPFSQFTRNSYLINPASIGTESNLEINVGRQFNTGEWSNIYTHYTNVNLELTPNRRANNSSHHTLGINLIGDKEGEYLSRSRVYALYNLHIVLSEKTSLAMGASLGVANYAVKGTHVSPSGAAAAPDGSIGLWLYDKEGSHVGFSVNQLANSKLTPIVETTRLKRHYNVSLRKAFQLSPHLSFYPALLVRYVPTYKTDWQTNASLVINDIFSVGAACRYKKNFSFIAGVEQIPAIKGHVKASFSYTLPAPNQLLANFYSYELTVTFFLDKREKKEPAEQEEK